MRIAVDIDGVLTNEIDGFDYVTRTPNIENIERVNRLHQAGHKIVLFTARLAQDEEITINWLKKHGVEYDWLVLEKMFYDILIDDHATHCFDQAENWICKKEREEMKKVNVPWNWVFGRLQKIDQADKIVYGIPKGGMCASAFLKKASVTHDPEKATLFLDDVVDSGRTKKIYEDRYPQTPFFALIDKKDWDLSGWLVFPWEKEHPGKEDTIQENIVRQLQYIGEDPNREGLLETPNRIVRAWEELFAGYKQDPIELLKTFSTDGYDQIVLLKNIELYSMCEHHMLPFYGKAHIAYLPDGRVLGVSKLARLVDIYARRLQIQERIGEQVTTALMEYLKPKGAACVIEADHMCMRMRGCSKQQSTMVTSSLKGGFFDNPQTRKELMDLLWRK